MPQPRSPKTEVPQAKQEPKILYQKHFRSLGHRSYSAHIKEATNGNHVLVLTEGKRDPQSDEVKKTRLFVLSEDFGAFFRMLHETAQWIRTNPVPEDVKRRRERFWAKQSSGSGANGGSNGQKETVAALVKTPMKAVVPTTPAAKSSGKQAGSPRKSNGRRAR